MISRLFAFTLLVLLIMSACQLTSKVSNGVAPPAAPNATRLPSSSTKAYDYIFSAPPNPLKLTTVPEAGSASEAVVPVKGGQVKATGSDGTVYTLDIPADALVRDTKIKMTPISSLSGLPFGGAQTHAVKLEPEGLFFYKDAILTIKPPASIALDKQIFFSYQADGDAPGLALPVVDSKEMKIHVIHFSGYGVTEGEISAVGLAQPTLGSDPPRRIESLEGEMLLEERSQHETGNPGSSSITAQTIIDLIDKYEEQVVKPALQAAGSSCEAGKEAINQVLRVERMRQLTGIHSDETLNVDISALLSQVSIVCVKEAYQQCVDEHVIHKMIPLWIGLMRQNALLGGEGSPEPEEVKLAEELTVKCLTFELRFESKGKFDPGGGGYDSAVQSTVRLQLDPNDFTIKGEGPLESIAFNFKPPAGCTATSTPGGGTFQTKSLAYVEDSHSETDELGYVRDFKLVYWPGVTSESFHVDCPPSNPSAQESHYTSPPSGYWSGIYFALHSDELNAGSGDSTANPGGDQPPGGADNPGGGNTQGGGNNPPGLPPLPDLSSLLSGGGAELGAVPAFPVPEVSADGGFYLDGWDVTPGELYATLEWSKEDGGIGLSENGIFKLYHKPGG